MKCEYKPKILKNYEINSIEDVIKDIMLYNIEYMDVEEAKRFLLEDAEPSIGSVSGLIYYNETEPIACEFYNEIVELVQEIYGNEIPFDLIKSLNNLTWFAFNYFRYEEFIDDVIEKALEIGIVENKGYEDE